MGDMDDGGAELPVQLDELGAHRGPELGIEIGQRLVEQKGLGLAHQRPPERHPLPLPARQLARLAAEQLADPQHRGDVADPARDLVAADPPELETEGQVLRHRHMRIERVVLEHDGNVAPRRVDIVDGPPADADRAARHAFEPGDHAQRGGFAAARGSEQDHELAIRDVERHATHRMHPVGVDLVDLVESDLRHEG